MEKLTPKSYLGYAVTDLGNNISFAAISVYLQLFYTDVLGAHFQGARADLWLTAITVIMVIARIWDGINDPIMGVLVQRAKPTRHGKFRHYLLYGGVPLAVMVVLMFIPFKQLSLAWCIVYAAATYIAYGMLYTVVLVPYGSLATVMTRNQNERSLLSIARSIGGGIGGVPAGMLFPILVYSVKVGADGSNVSYLDGTKLLMAMSVIAVIMLAAYVIGFRCVKEQYAYPNEAQKLDLKGTAKALLHNKPFLIMGLVGMLLIASSMYVSAIDVYLFNVFYGRTGMMLYVTLATYTPMALTIPFSGIIIKKVGKKEMCTIGLSLSVIASLIMACFRLSNPWLFIAFSFLQGTGIGFLTLEIWAMAMDVIDYQELLTGKREEAPCYALFTFMRKIGQAIAALVPVLLMAVGYAASNGYGGQSEETINGIYTIATVVPLVLFVIMLILMLAYPLNKANDAAMRNKLAAQRAIAEGNAEPCATKEEGNADQSACKAEV